jgi:hypothetical protein
MLVALLLGLGGLVKGVLLEKIYGFIGEDCLVVFPGFHDA